MLRTPVSNKMSIRVITILLAIAALVTIWPLRLYHETISFIGGKVTEISDYVTENEDAGEYFTAQYDHLDSIEVYIESVEEGELFTAQLFDQTDGVNTQIAIERVAFPENDLPGYVAIPIDVDVEPGNVYVLILTGAVRKHDPSTFRVGFESAEAAAANPNGPVYNVAFHHDTGISGLALAMRVHYEEPLTKARSALAGGIIAALAILALALQWLYYRKRPQAEHYVPLLTVLRYALTPVIVIPAVIGVIAVFPLRLYDSRVMDVLLYEFGIIMAALFLLYGLWRSRIGLPERWQSSADLLAHAREILMVIDIALIVRSSCTYMNAVNDYVHRDSEAQIVIGLVILILLLGRLSWAVNIWTILTAVAAIACGVMDVRAKEMLLVSEGGHEMAEQMANAISQAVARGFLWVAMVSVLVMLVDVWRERRTGRMAGAPTHDAAADKTSAAAGHTASAGETATAAGTASSTPQDGPTAGIGGARGTSLGSVIGVDGSIRIFDKVYTGTDDVRVGHILTRVLAAFLILAVTFRNERTWLLVLAIVWVLFYARYACAAMRRDSMRWLRIVSYGILLHFACNVVWTMFRRYYLAYNYSRFSMQFHTVTVTAYYLLIVSAAALALFLAKFRAVYVLPWRERLRRMWFEILVLGVVCSYMVMSMTRAGVYALAVIAFVGVVCTFHGLEHAVRCMAKAIGTIALVTVLTFPSIFTGQRIISTTVAEPVLYAPVEEYFDVLMRHTPWNSTEFMNLEIFLRDSMDRLIGGGIGSQIYYRLRWNIPQGYDTASLDGTGADAGELLAAGNMVPGGDQMTGCTDTPARMYENAESGNAFSGGGQTTGCTDTPATMYDNAEPGDILDGTTWFAADGSESVSELLTDIRYGITESPMVAAVSDEVIAGITTGNYTGNGFSNGRTDIWRAYLAEMNLTGHEGMDLTLANGEIAIHAHNIFVQMAYDCGVPAGILFAAVLAVALIGSVLYYRRHRRQALPLFPLLLILGYLITGMVEWIFHLDNPYTIVLLMTLAPLMFRDEMN